MSQRLFFFHKHFKCTESVFQEAGFRTNPLVTAAWIQQELVSGKGMRLQKLPHMIVWFLIPHRLQLSWWWISLCKDLLVFIFCVWMFACTYVYCVGTWCLWTPEEGARSPGLEEQMVVIHSMDAGNQTWVFCSSTKHSKQLSHFFSPPPPFFKK